MADKEISFKELTHFLPKQHDALEAVKGNKFTLYGGAMGGGKSYFLRWVAVYLLLMWAARGIKNVRVGLFCEDYPSLTDRHLIKIETEFPRWLGILNKSNHEFRLRPQFGGGIISFRNLDEPGKYASSEFAAVLVDELTKNIKDRFDLLRTRMRWPGIADTKFIAGTNPGSIGHDWVKKMWIIGEFEPGELEADQFAFIRATAHDNTNLDKSYFMTLEGLPDEMKKAFLDGDWDLFQGQFFSEWREVRHVIEPFTPPREWRRYRSIDYGRTAPFCCKWYAVDYDGRAYVYKEYYKAGVDADINFQEVVKLSKYVDEFGVTHDEEYQWTVLDAACWAATYGAKFNEGRGETIADIAWKNGVHAVPSPKSRKSGWTLMHQYLRWWKVEDNGIKEIVEPKIVYMRTCVDSIRTIPTLIFDKHDPEDLDTKGEDHAADTDSYFLQLLNEGKTNKPAEGANRTFSMRFNTKIQGNDESPINKIFLG